MLQLQFPIRLPMSLDILRDLLLVTSRLVVQLLPGMDSIDRIGIPELACEGGMLLRFSQPAAKAKVPHLFAPELVLKMADSVTQPPPELLLQCIEVVEVVEVVKVGAHFKERIPNVRDGVLADATNMSIFIRTPTLVAVMATASADEMRAAIFATRKDEATWAHLALLEQQLLGGTRLEPCEGAQLFQPSAAGLAPQHRVLPERLFSP